MMKFFATVLILLGATAARAEFGLNVGVGAPYLSQYGLNYQMSSQFALAATYNALDVSSGSAKVQLNMPEVMFHFYPLSGSWFVGAGVGMEKLSVSSTSQQGTAKAEVEAMTTIAKTGWMWGLANGGFWFGVDYAYIMPTSPKVTITAPGVPTNSQEYRDVVDASKKFGETAYGNLTFVRLGYLF